MQQMNPMQKNHIDAGEPEMELYFTASEQNNAQIGEIIEPAGDFWPEEIDEKEPETDRVS